jgi:hypothetical protein
MVERRSEKPAVGGSSPLSSIMSDWDFPKVTLEVLNDIKNLSLYIETLPSIINANLGGSIHTLIFLSMLAIPLITIIQAFFIVDLQHLIETALMNIFGQF